VFAPVVQLGPGDLAGNYAGAQGSATLGVGVGWQRACRRLQQFDRAAAAERARPGRRSAVPQASKAWKLRPGRNFTGSHAGGAACAALHPKHRKFTGDIFPLAKIAGQGSIAAADPITGRLQN
jgi:hypothetical protein